MRHFARSANLELRIRGEKVGPGTLETYEIDALTLERSARIDALECAHGDATRG